MNKTIENEIDTINLSPAFFAAKKLRSEKGSDYGSIIDYFPFGDYSFVQMLHIKTKRLVNLTGTGNVPKHEDVKQNLLDLINYASYYYEWLEGVLDE